MSEGPIEAYRRALCGGKLFHEPNYKMPIPTPIPAHDTYRLHDRDGKRVRQTLQAIVRPIPAFVTDGKGKPTYYRATGHSFVTAAHAPHAGEFPAIIDCQECTLADLERAKVKPAEVLELE